MSHPTRLDIFRAWSKAMEQGAIVGKPNYRGSSTHRLRPAKKHRSRQARTTRIRRMRRKEMRNG